MKNEERIVELLAEQLIRQDLLIEEMKNVKVEIVEMKTEIVGMKNEIVEMKTEIVEMKKQLGRHQGILEHILEALTDDVPKYNEVLDVEYLKEGKQIVLHKHTYGKTF